MMMRIAMTLLSCGLLLTSTAALAAGDVYFNGVQVDPRSLKGNTFTSVNLTVDANGDIIIDAPRYQIQVQGTSDAAELDPVEAGTHWLVVQDDNSTGHTIDVVVNDRIVKTVSSGGGQVIFDLAPYLKRGTNDIRINAKPGPAPAGGDLVIYIGQGSNDSGTVSMRRPDIAYSRGASDPPTGGSRSYSLTVE
jgi:hypothetical protein